MCAESGGLPGRGGDLLPDHLPHTEGRGAHRLVLQGVRLQARLPATGTVQLYLVPRTSLLRVQNLMGRLRILGRRVADPGSGAFCDP